MKKATPKATKKVTKAVKPAPPTRKATKPTKNVKSATAAAPAVRTLPPVKPASPTKTTKVPKPVKAAKPAKAEADKKLTSAEIDAFKEKLLVMRARLRGDVSMMTDAALNKNRMEASGDLSAMPIHMADVGSDNFEQEQTLSFMQSENDLLDKVEEALGRIKDGTYGVCEACECRIPKVRLNFLPYASMCVRCAEIAQQEENS